MERLAELAERAASTFEPPAVNMAGAPRALARRDLAGLLQGFGIANPERPVDEDESNIILGTVRNAVTHSFSALPRDEAVDPALWQS